MNESPKAPKNIAPSSTAPTATSSAKPRVAMPEKGTLVKKTGNAKGGTDPYTQAKPSRTKVTATSGARYGIRVKFQKTVAPEAGATQSNGRILPAAMVRQSQSFGAGTADHN